MALQAELTTAWRRIDELTEQAQASLRATSDAERAMAEAIRDFKRKLHDSRRETKAARDRISYLEARLDGTGTHEDPESQFRHEIRLAWERTYIGSDKRNHPLRPYLLGPNFLDSADTLHGVDRTKIIDVCLDVITHRAVRIASRGVHPLRDGEGPEKRQLVRASDGATAWRASLQRGTASARRLHYWKLPDGQIELSRVGVHDDLTIV